MSHELRTASLSCVVDPRRGLSLSSLIGPSGDEWLFFDPARGPEVVGKEAAYDDVWRGGFEELFPSDAPGTFDGRVLPDHGELWRSPFEVTEASGLRISGRRFCDSVPAVVEKSVALDADRASLVVGYRITNRGVDQLRFLFKLHPALRVEAGDAVELPGGGVSAVVPGFGATRTDVIEPWPTTLDLSRVRGREAGFQEFVYVRDMPAGWCGIRRAASGERFRLHFDRHVFPECWLFITYGGWRNYHTIVLEPCTNWPKDMHEAATRGRCAVLAPGASLETQVTVQITPAND